MKLTLDNLLEEPLTEYKTLLETEKIEDTEDTLTSTYFKTQDKLLVSLLDTENDTDTQKEDTTKKICVLEYPEQFEVASEYTEKIILEAWRNIENISARLIEITDPHILLECLVDKEKGIYEERVFKPTLFKGFKLEIGKLFYLRFFERANEMKIQIHDDPDLTLQDDFPKISLAKKYKTSRLFK